jgi:mannose-1-phosphate guanylyltransferase
LVVSLEAEPEFFVLDAQGTITVSHDGLRHDRLNLLRHHANVGTVAAVVAEPIVAKAVRQVAEQGDIVLEPDVRSTPAAAATAAAATTATTAAAESATATAAESATAAAAESTTTAAAAESAATTATETRAAARGLQVCRPAGTDISERIAAA